MASGVTPRASRVSATVQSTVAMRGMDCTPCSVVAGLACNSSGASRQQIQPVFFSKRIDIPD
ncbi:hypothetical protein D3C76_1725660 [compost metagenome]